MSLVRLVLKVLLGQWAPLGQQVLPVPRVMLVLKGRRVPKASKGRQVNQELPVPLEPRAP